MKKKALIICLVIILALGGGVGIYLSDYYHATAEAVGCIDSPSKDITVTRVDGNYVFAPESPDAGIIFYPGGKVQAESYAPLMTALARRGVLCVLVPMPGNLAVFGVNSADGVADNYTEIKSWYMAGHSLGGSMAASYIEKNSAAFDGLILLASYSTADLSGKDISVLSIYGDRDGVMNKDSYNENRLNLPDVFTERIIEGGCHAYFGSYGEQKGDGKATLTPEEQIELTADIILEYI